MTAILLLLLLISAQSISAPIAMELKQTITLRVDAVPMHKTASFMDNQMKKEAEKIDVKTVNPKDIGVSFGPVMDEKTFKEYQKRKDGRMNVISATDLQKMFGQRK
jgi:competence protein ComGF